VRWEGHPIVVEASCPVCSSTMVLRTARQGRNAGNQFLGCSRYPACRATRPVSDGGVRRRRYVSFSPRFRRQMRRGFSHFQVFKIGVFIFAIVLAATASFFASWPHITYSPRNASSHEAPVPLNSGFLIDVIDGDTVRSSGKVYRLVGFNTPETGTNARCEHERVLAARATQRLRQLTAAGELELEPVRCACQPGTEGTERCNYGRSCAVLRARGQDVGSILIAEGLAEEYVCGTTSCPPRRNWCGH
jgi:endonuclease YncB( thermonuclease family)